MKQILLYGKNVFQSILEVNKKVYKAFVLNDSRFHDSLFEKKIPFEVVDRKYLDNLTFHANHQGIAFYADEYNYSTIDKLIESKKENATFLMLDGIEDPNNFGAIIRIVDALGVDGIIIAKDRQALVTPAVYQSSTGALNYVKIALVTNLNATITKLKENGHWIVGAEASNSVDYNKVDYKNTNITLVVGSEGKGIGQLLIKNCDYLVKIPQYGNVNSLNVSVATGIIINEIIKQKKG